MEAVPAEHAIRHGEGAAWPNPWVLSIRKATQAGALARAPRWRVGLVCGRFQRPDIVCAAVQAIRGCQGPGVPDLGSVDVPGRFMVDLCGRKRNPAPPRRGCHALYD